MGRVVGACAIFVLLSPGCASTGTASQRWVLVDVESARIAETLSSGGAWDQDASAAQADHEADFLDWLIRHSASSSR